MSAGLEIGEIKIRRIVELHQITIGESSRALVIVRVRHIGPCGHECEIGRALSAPLLEDVLGHGLKFVFEQARLGFPHCLHDADSGLTRRFPDDGNLTLAFDEAEPVDDRIKILYSQCRLPGGLAELLQERVLS